MSFLRDYIPLWVYLGLVGLAIVVAGVFMGLNHEPEKRERYLSHYKLSGIQVNNGNTTFVYSAIYVTKRVE